MQTQESPLELLQAGVAQGQRHVQVFQLKKEHSPLEKERAKAVLELGKQAWEFRVSHPDYQAHFEQLAELERERTEAQRELDELLMSSSHSMQLLSQLNEGFSARIDEVKTQRRAAASRLSKVVSDKRQASEAEIERLNAEQQRIQSEMAQYDTEITNIQHEQTQTVAPIDGQLSELQAQIQATKQQVISLNGQMNPLFSQLGERVTTIRPEAPFLDEAYQQIDQLDGELTQKAEQIATLEEQIATAPPKTRRTFYLLAGTVAAAVLLLLVWFAATLLSGDGPRDVAQAYADAIVEEDNETAIGYFEHFAEEIMGIDLSSEEGKKEVIYLFEVLNLTLNMEYGQLEDAVALAPQMEDDDHAEVMVVWHHADADLAQVLSLDLIDSEWTITDMGNRPIEGELKGNTFIASESGRELGLADDSPIVTVTPSAFTLAMQLEVAEEIGEQVTATVLELERSQSFDGGFVQFEDLPLGQYTVRLSAPGFEDHEIEVEARGDEALPDVITATLGTPLPMDPNNTLLLANGRGNYQLVTITSEGMLTHWSQAMSKLKGWSPDFKSIEFANRTGIGQIDVAGQITLEWNAPAEVQNNRSATYRPDLQEIAYIQNKDLFTLATEEGAEPVRWSKIGLFKGVWGWFDNDTVLIRTESNKIYVLRRDGSGYEFPEAYASSSSQFFDRAGWLRLVYHNNIFYQPGQEAVKRVLELPRGSHFYGWSHDNNYLLIHSLQDERGATSGLMAIDKDGKMTQIAPNFISPRRNLLAWDIAPSSNKIALSWQPGRLYIGDAESETMETTNYSFEAYNMFWPTADTLIYVINEGSKIGTWRLSLGNEEQEAEKLFDYRAEHVTATPDGRLLLVANDTLWEYDGTGTPQALGEEGSLQMGRDRYFVWPEQ